MTTFQDESSRTFPSTSDSSGSGASDGNPEDVIPVIRCSIHSSQRVTSCPQCDTPFCRLCSATVSADGLCENCQHVEIGLEDGTGGESTQRGVWKKKILSKTHEVNATPAEAASLLSVPPETDPGLFPNSTDIQGRKNLSFEKHAKLTRRAEIGRLVALGVGVGVSLLLMSVASFLLFAAELDEEKKMARAAGISSLACVGVSLIVGILSSLYLVVVDGCFCEKLLRVSLDERNDLGDFRPTYLYTTLSFEFRTRIGQESSDLAAKIERAQLRHFVVPILVSLLMVPIALLFSCLEDLDWNSAIVCLVIGCCVAVIGLIITIVESVVARGVLFIVVSLAPILFWVAMGATIGIWSGGAFAHRQIGGAFWRLVLLAPFIGVFAVVLLCWPPLFNFAEFVSSGSRKKLSSAFWMFFLVIVFPPSWIGVLLFPGIAVVVTCLTMRWPISPSLLFAYTLVSIFEGFLIPTILFVALEDGLRWSYLSSGIVLTVWVFPILICSLVAFVRLWSRRKRADVFGTFEWWQPGVCPTLFVSESERT